MIETPTYLSPSNRPKVKPATDFWLEDSSVNLLGEEESDPSDLDLDELLNELAKNAAEIWNRGALFELGRFGKQHRSCRINSRPRIGCHLSMTRNSSASRVV